MCGIHTLIELPRVCVCVVYFMRMYVRYTHADWVASCVYVCMCVCVYVYVCLFHMYVCAVYTR
jgi:hypothetical protein